MIPATQDSHHVADEIEDHKSEISEWIKGAESFTASPSHVGTVTRFVRDCKTLIEDLNGATEPSAADLCDFDDRCKSLEIQYNNIEQDLKPE